MLTNMINKHDEVSKVRRKGKWAMEVGGGNES